MSSNFCCRCGAALRLQSKFCKICGAPVSLRKDPEDLRPMDRAHDSKEPNIALMKEYILVPEEKQNDSPVKKGSQAVNVHGKSIDVPFRQKVAPVCRRDLLKVILATVLCLLIFVWSVGAILLADIQISLSPEQIDATLGSALDVSVLMEIPASWIFPDVVGRSQTVVEWSLDKIEEVCDDSVDITMEIAEQFLYDSTFLSFMIQELGDCILDIRNDTGQSGITISELQAFIEDNRLEIESFWGEKLETGEIEIIAISIENQGLLEVLGVQNLRSTAPAVYSIVKVGLSYRGIGIFCVLSLLFVVLLAKVNGWSFWHTSGDVGVVLVVIGSIFLSATAFTVWFPDIWHYVLYTNRLMFNLTGVVLKNGLLLHIVVLVVGTVLCVIKMIWKKICQRRVPC